MAKRIMVDPAKLETAANKMESQAADYERQFKLLFSEVDGMGAAWKGADNVAFVTQIKGFEEDFQTMKGIMEDYSRFLKISAKMYRETQNDVISGAKRLTN